MRNENWVGFANVYLDRCKQESITGDKIDRELYSKLVELDTRLGTKVSEQLYKCLLQTARSDIIKVELGFFINVIK